LQLCSVSIYLFLQFLTEFIVKRLNAIFLYSGVPGIKFGIHQKGPVVELSKSPVHMYNQEHKAMKDACLGVLNTFLPYLSPEGGRALRCVYTMTPDKRCVLFSKCLCSN